MRMKIKLIPDEILKVTGTPKDGVCEMEIIGKDEVLIKLKRKSLAPEAKLTAIIKADNGEFMAFCPELDLVTAKKTEDAAFKDLVEMARGYAEEYMKELEVYLRSPNRTHHYDYVKALSNCKSSKDCGQLFVKV